MGNLCSQGTDIDSKQENQNKDLLTGQYGAIKQKWIAIYGSAPQTLEKMKEVNGVLTAFNACVDAVKKVTPEVLNRWIKETNATDSVLTAGKKGIFKPEDFITGTIDCFKHGKGEEWMLEEHAAYEWLNDHIGKEEGFQQQMGGQGGIIANVMSTCKVQKVFCCTGSHPELQSSKFVKNDNVFAADQNGEIKLAHQINRSNEPPYINTVFEFSKGEVLEAFGQKIECPRANRFIACYGKGQFDLHIDPYFLKAAEKIKTPVDFVVLSGYQVMSEILTDGKTKGSTQIDKSWDYINHWKSLWPQAWIHLEYASTSDQVVLKHLVDTIGKKCDSTGCNEQELTDILNVIGKTEEANACQSDKHAKNLFLGLRTVFKYLGVKRIQLHFLGIYITLVKPDYHQSAEVIRNGMILAGTIGAAKAKVGDIEQEKNLLLAHGTPVADLAVQELQSLAETVKAQYGGENDIVDTGIYKNSEFTLVATPTILIDKPITLVGLGDTISSLSLVGSR